MDGMHCTNTDTLHLEGQWDHKTLAKRYILHSMDLRQCYTLLLFLLTFFASTALYFYLWIPDSAPSVLAAGVKAAPVLSLAFMVLHYRGWRSLLGVAGGLLMSAGGDICLIWDHLFLPGMVCFAVAHLLYSFSFYNSYNCSHSSSSCGIYFFNLLLWGAGGGIYVYLLPFLQKSPKPEIFVPGVGVYMVLILLMATLAMETRRPFVMLGGLVFMLSDFTLALQNFKVVQNLYHGHHIVMITYYLAQLFIAIGEVMAMMAEQAKEVEDVKQNKCRLHAEGYGSLLTTDII